MSTPHRHDEELHRGRPRGRRDPEQEILNRAELAILFGRSAKTIKRYEKLGLPICGYVGVEPRYRRADALRWIRAHSGQLGS